jgi:hypothetical protein
LRNRGARKRSGSISAGHGIGVEKQPGFGWFPDAEEIVPLNRATP